MRRPRNHTVLPALERFVGTFSEGRPLASTRAFCSRPQTLFTVPSPAVGENHSITGKLSSSVPVWLPPRSVNDPTTAFQAILPRESFCSACPSQTIFHCEDNGCVYIPVDEVWRAISIAATAEKP